MIVKNSITLEPKHGQYYARWRSDELVVNKNGEEVEKQYFEPTYVPLPKEGASEEEVKAKMKFAEAVAEYMAELVSKKKPSAELQRIKLMEFARRSAEDSDEVQSIQEFIPLFLIEYAHEERHGRLLSHQSVCSMAHTWDLFLKKLGRDRKLHPSIVSTAKLQSILDKLPGKDKKTHLFNLQYTYKYASRTGVVLKGMNPAEDVVIKENDQTSKHVLKQFGVQLGIHYMANIRNGDQWQRVTLCGVYTPMRFLTACRLQLMPPDFVKPEKPRACAFLNTNSFFSLASG
jgi:hypothetical protein